MFKKSELLFLISLFWSCSPFAQEIYSLTSKADKVSVGEVIPVVLSLKSGVSTNAYCGLEFNFGDGVIETIRAQQNENSIVSIDLTHTYANPGKYTISAEGKFYFRGIYSAIACLGQSKQVVINVIDDAVEKSKEEAKNQIKILAEKELELQKKEKELQAMQLQVLASKESELQRKEAELQQKTEQVDREKQISLQALSRRAKKVEHPIQTPEKLNVSRAKPSAVVPVQISISTPATSPVAPIAPAAAKGYKSVDGF